MGKLFTTTSNCQRRITACLMIMFSSACSATSRMEAAAISESKGAPCFSIPKNSETKNGIPLHSILVSEIKGADWRTLPEELWSFSVVPPTDSILLRPENCIRYGETPDSAKQGKLRPLEFFHVYSVGVAARPVDSNIIAYGARFCIKPVGNGRIAIQILSPNSDAKDTRCAKQD